MPLYEYQCEACDHRFEQIRKFSDPPLTVCPACGGAVRKLVSSPAIQFKGTGWYVTDYAKKGTSDTAASEGEKSESGGDAKEKKTDSSKSADSTASSAKNGDSAKSSDSAKAPSKKES